MREMRLKENPFEEGFEESPMAAVANLVDVMLVFVCGLLVAIIMYWNVNLQDVEMILDADQIVRVENDNQVSSASNYDDLGSAYVDPLTGEVVVIGDGK